MDMKPRKAFTAIEILVVLVVALVLIGMAVPALMGALRKGSVNDAANAIMRVSSQARQLARTRQLASAGRYYGIVIVAPADGSSPYAALTHGPTAAEDTILRYNGKPVSKLLFNRNVVVYTGREHNSATAVPLTTEIGWLYQYRTGYPIVDASPTAVNVNLGVDPDYPNPTPGINPLAFPLELRHITMATADGRYRTAVAIYQIGLANVQDF